MRRKNGNELVKNEKMVLTAIAQLHSDGHTEFHGYKLNHFLEDNGRKLVASTLYRILHRLEERGFLTSRWEQAPHGTQWRNLQSLTPEGLAAAEPLEPINFPNLRAMPTPESTPSIAASHARQQLSQ